MKTINFLLVGLCIVLLFFPGFTSSQIFSVQESMSRGVTCYNHGDYPAALTIFTDVTLSDPSYPYGWLWKGDTLKELGRTAEGDESYKIGRCLLDPDCSGTLSGKNIPTTQVSSAIHPGENSPESAIVGGSPPPLTNISSDKRSAHDLQNGEQEQNLLSPVQGLKSPRPSAIPSPSRQFVPPDTFPPSPSPPPVASRPNLSSQQSGASQKGGSDIGEYSNAVRSANSSRPQDLDSHDPSVVQPQKSNYMEDFSPVNDSLRNHEMIDLPLPSPSPNQKKTDISVKINDMPSEEEKIRPSLSSPDNHNPPLDPSSQVKQGRYDESRSTPQRLEPVSMTPGPEDRLPPPPRDLRPSPHEPNIWEQILSFMQKNLFLLMGGTGLFLGFLFRKKLFG